MATGFPPDEAERHGSDQRGDAGVGDADDQLRQADQPEAVGRDQGDRAGRDARHRRGESGALVRRAVDERAGRRRGEEAREPHGEARRGRVEALLLQVHAQERTETLAGSGQGEVKGEEARDRLHRPP